MVIGSHADFCMPEMRGVARNLETGVCKSYLLCPNSLILSPILLFALKTLQMPDIPEQNLLFT